MFVMLNRLNRVRRKIGLERPERRGSMALRHVDAGSCNGCEHELGAATNPFYDLERFGIEIAASPRHADLLLVTGPITTRMVEPLLTAYRSMPEPRLVAALGDCALGCSAFSDSPDVAGDLASILPVDLEIPGCPPTPDEIAAALAGALDLIKPLPGGVPVRHTDR